MRKIDLLNELFSLGGPGGGGGGEAVEYKSFTDNGDNTITAVDVNDVEHAIEYTLNADGSFASVSYDGEAVPFEYETDGNLVSVGETEIDVSEAPIEELLFKFYDFGDDMKARKIWINDNIERIPIGYFYNVLSSPFANITTLKLPKELRLIEAQAFTNCSTLTNVIFNDKLEVIDLVSYSYYGAFSYCNLSAVDIPASIIRIDGYSFSRNPNLQIVSFRGNVPDVAENVFLNCSNVVLYNFSKHTGTVPSLYSVGSLGHKANCVIRVPQMLLSDWRTSTNWVDLTDVIWQFPITSSVELPGASSDYAGVQAWVSDEEVYQCNLVADAYEWQLVEGA